MFCSTLSSIVVQTAITFLLLIKRDAQSITLLEVFDSLCLDQIIHLLHNILTVILLIVALVCTKYPMHYHHNSKVSIFDTKSARAYRAYTES
jgi:cytochrome c biogenesis factor